MKMFNSCINDPSQFLCVRTVEKNGTNRIDFVQNLDYKFIELLSIDFFQAPESIVDKSITFRYNSLRTKLALALARLQNVNTIIKTKNPALLKTIHQSAIRKSIQYK